MKREIKFRGKDKDGRWWYGSYLYLPDSDSHHIIPCGSYKPSVNAFSVEQVEVAPSTVGQYTGLCDCNGKEIYEGDVVRSVEGTYRVEYDGGGYCIFDIRTDDNCRTLFALLSRTSVTIIGNIHDNPELLKGGGK